jgi:hypothetical protein
MKIWQKVASGLAVPVLGAAAYLGVSLSSTSAPASNFLPYQSSDGRTITSQCAGTSPNFLIHSGGADITVYPGSDKFVVDDTSGQGTQWDDPYLNAGYSTSTPSSNCNGSAGDSPLLPVKLGQQGNPVASIHTITGMAPSYTFYGNTGYDFWFTPSPADDTYQDMSGGGGFAPATEVMIWTTNTHLVLNTTNIADYPVIIGGYHWDVQVGLASDGHGKTDKTPAGWTVVNFISRTMSLGDNQVDNLRLDPFLSYAISHGYMSASYYWEGFNVGMEITDGNAMLAGFSETGLK